MDPFWKSKVRDKITMKNLPGGDGIVGCSVTKTDPEKKNYCTSIHLNYLAGLK